MKKLTLSVSASFLAIAGCGGDPAPKQPGEIYTNSLAQTAQTASATPSASPSASAPEPVPAPVPRPEDYVRTTNATPVEVPQLPPPPTSAKPTKPGPPKHTNSMPR